jgi:thiamine pyrophosphate-dependent acetolactate synthase large subunit-like protein
MAMKVSEVFVDTLVEAGVKRVCGLAGDSLNGIADAIRKNKSSRPKASPSTWCAPSSAAGATR